MIQNTHSVKTILVAVLVAVIAVIAPLSTLTAEAREGRSVRGAADTTCMQTAVSTREAALITAFDTFNTDVKTALIARKAALNDAWGSTTVSERNVALKDAWKTWKSAHKEAFKDLKAARKEAWDTFKSTVKTTCKTDLPKDEALTTDGAGSVSL